jgi:hypothetical protein
MKSLKHKKKYTRKNAIKMNKKINKKNKTLVGGRPKINFPYTYFRLDYNFIQKHNTLNHYLNTQLKYSFGVDKNGPIINNNNQYCIIVLKYDDAYNLSKNESFIDDLNFLNKILGFATITYYKNVSVIGIFDVCLHKLNITENQQQKGIYITNEKPHKEGYGTVLFNCIYTSITLIRDISFNHIWIGIKIDDVRFKQLAWMYSSRGFSNPVYTNTTPDGLKMQFNFIALTNNKIYVNDENHRKLIFNETMDLYNQIIQHPRRSNNGIFSLAFQFDKSCILSLRLMPFLSFSENKDVIGMEDFYKQRETSGRFIVYDSYMNYEYNENENEHKNENDEKRNDEIGIVTYMLSMDTLNDKSINYNIGEMGNVTVAPNSEKVFHTHPMVNYVVHKVLIGPPSGDDFLESFYTFNRQFSVVVAIEGIYIFSLSEFGIMSLKNGKTVISNDVKNTLEYRDRVSYDWSTYNSDNNVDENAINDEVNKYLNWFNSKKNNDNNNWFNYFDVQFKKWKELDENTEFNIYYYNSNRIKINQ